MKPSFLIICFALLISFCILADGRYLLVDVGETTDAKGRGLHFNYHDHSLHHGGKPGPYSDDHDSHHSGLERDHEHSLHHGGKPGPYLDEHQSHHLESTFDHEHSLHHGGKPG